MQNTNQLKESRNKSFSNLAFHSNDGKSLNECEKLLTKTIVCDMINDKNNALGNQERELLLYNYMMNNKMRKKDVIIKDIIEIKDSFIMNMKSINQSNLNNQSCDGFLNKLNNSELNINNSVNLKAN